MALYLFEHPETGVIREVYFKLEDKKEYFGEDGEEKVKWHRRFTIPYASTNTKVSDPFSQKDFMQRTEGKNLTLGDMWDESARLAEQREKKVGEDPVKKQHFDTYAKKRKGLKHLQDTRDKKEVQEKFQPKVKAKASD